MQRIIATAKMRITIAMIGIIVQINALRQKIISPSNFLHSNSVNSLLNLPFSKSVWLSSFFLEIPIEINKVK